MPPPAFPSTTGLSFAAHELAGDVWASGELVPAGTPVEILGWSAVPAGGWIEYLVRAPRDPSAVYEETRSQWVRPFGSDDVYPHPLVETHVEFTVMASQLRVRRPSAIRSVVSV